MHIRANFVDQQVFSETAAAAIAHDAKKVHALTNKVDPLCDSTDIYSRLLISWLEQHDPQYMCSHPREEIEKLISDTLDLLMGVLNYFSCSPSLLSVVLKYANTFVARNGIRQVVLLHLLLISTIEAIKMWGTENMAVNQIVADLFQLAIVDINNMEREFLRSLNYELYLTQEDIVLFVDSITTTQTVVSILSSAVGMRSRAPAPLQYSVATTPTVVVAAPTHKRKAAYHYQTRSCKQQRQFFKPEIFV